MVILGDTMKNDTMKWMSAMLIISLLLLGACGERPEMIKIGAVHSLSGELADVAHGSVNGVRMAVDDFQAATGIAVRLIEEDDLSCEEKSAGASKLINVDGVEAIVGTICSSMTLAIAPIAAPDTIVMSGVSTSVAISDAGPHVFRTIPADDSKAIKVAQELERGGFARVAFIFANDNDYSVTAVTDVQKSLAEGIEIVAEETGIVTTHDFRTQLLKANEAKPDALVLSFTNPAQFADVMTQWDELGFARLPVYTTSETIENEEVIALGGKSVEGILFPAFAAPDGPAVDSFRERYRARFGEEVPAYAAEAYDGTMITLKALARSGTRQEALEQINAVGSGYEGASGTITFDEHGDVRKPLVMKTIKDGAFVELP